MEAPTVSGGQRAPLTDMTIKQQLRIPGPTPLPMRVSRAATRPMINPKGPEFAALLEQCVTGLQSVLQTQNEILLFGASGTGGLEATVANLLSPGERVLFCTNGWFSELWSRMAAAFRADVVRLSAPWGQAVDVEEIERVLAADARISKVFVTHNETSTAVLNDIAAIAEVVKAAGCLLAVDSVSGVPCHALPIDELGLDVVVTASQKGWLAPPGLTMIAVSDAAIRAATEAKCPRWYFDFLCQKSCQGQGFMQSTPPISVMYALQEGLAMIRDEGVAEMWQRHERLGQMARLGLQAAGLELVARSDLVSNSVTAIHSPFSSPQDLACFLSDLRTQYGLVLANGLGIMEGKVFRVGHLGSLHEDDVDAMLASLTDGLTALSRRVGVHPKQEPSRHWRQRTTFQRDRGPAGQAA
jgi:aspartate aminotransferase-like enzyme